MPLPNLASETHLMIALRLLVLGLAIHTMQWTAGQTLSLAQGRWNLRAAYRSVLFFLGAGTVSFQTFAVFGTPTEATRAGSTLLLAIGFGLCVYIKRQSPRYDQLIRALDYIGEAMALVDLARVDLPAARRIAEECRRLTAEGMTNRG